MNGWATHLEGSGARPAGVIGVVVAQNFPDSALIRAKLEEGLARVAPGTVWVMREAPKVNHAVSIAWAVLREHGVEPFLAPLVPTWKHLGLPVSCSVLTHKEERAGGYDLRTDWRDGELRQTCERIIVFHDASSGVTAEWVAKPGKIFVIERGKKRAKFRGRKPIGA